MYEYNTGTVATFRNATVYKYPDRYTIHEWDSRDRAWAKTVDYRRQGEFTSPHTGRWFHIVSEVVPNGHYANGTFCSYYIEHNHPQSWRVGRIRITNAPTWFSRYSP